MEDIQVRLDDQNRYSWDNIRSVFQDGILTNRFISYDNGTTAQSFYMDGKRVEMIQTDSQLNGGAKSWDTIKSYYGPDGALAARVTIYDNGLFKEETFENGVRSKTIQMDNPQDPNGAGVKSWDVIETYYDQEGQIEARITQYDNGIFKEESFEAGVRTYVRQMDNPQDLEGNGAKNWDTIETYYDASGQIEARLINYDDGRVRQDSFENGVRTATEIQDGAYEGGEGNYAWTAMNMYYDENGALAHKFTVYDDGRVRQDDYIDGVRHTSIIEDKYIFNGGNYNWDTQHFVYDDSGSVAERQVTYDDGDEMLQTYVDGNLIQKSEYDGDNSEAWLGRVTTYNDDGSVASTETYNDTFELPEDFFINPMIPFEALG